MHLRTNSFSADLIKKAMAQEIRSQVSGCLSLGYSEYYSKLPPRVSISMRVFKVKKMFHKRVNVACSIKSALSGQRD